MSGQDTPAGGTPPGVASDQSMEDILASIRRILNEDESASAPSAGPATMPEPGAGAESVPPSVEAEPLLLTEDMMVSLPDEPESAPTAEPPSSPEPAPLVSPNALLAPAVAAAAAASVGELLRAVSTERSAAVHRGGPTIEDVVREELRPLLKDWLDQHLPALVERLVRVEIERVVGRALS